MPRDHTNHSLRGPTVVESSSGFTFKTCSQVIVDASLGYTHRQAKDMKRPTEQGPLFIEHFLPLRGWDHSPTLMGIGGVCLRTALLYINPRWVHQISRENGLQYPKVVVTEIRASLSCKDMGSVSCGTNIGMDIGAVNACFWNL